MLLIYFSFPPSKVFTLLSYETVQVRKTINVVYKIRKINTVNGYKKVNIKSNCVQCCNNLFKNSELIMIQGLQIKHN